MDHTTTKYFEFLKKLECETPDSIMNKLCGISDISSKEWRKKFDFRGTESKAHIGVFDNIDPILIPILAKDAFASACYLFYLVEKEKEFRPNGDNTKNLLQKSDKIKTFLKMSLENIKNDSYSCYVLISMRYRGYGYNAIFEDYRNEFEKIISKDELSCYWYAKGDFYGDNNDKDQEKRARPQARFELGEQTIANNGYWAYWYARNILNSDWNSASPEIAKIAEENIAKCTNIIDDEIVPLRYIKNHKKKSWPAGEPTISTHANSSLAYAELIGKEFPAGEEQISKSAELSFKYAKLINKRFELGEPAISKNAKLSFLYARDIVDGRFELAEPTIMDDPEVMLQYAIEVIRGQLPEDMHNRMIGKAIAA